MTHQRKIVLSDIAKAANVHTSTVSLALRNSPKISLTTRKKIKKIADEMGYQPDPGLLSLVAYRKHLNQASPKASIAVVSDQHPSKNIPDLNPYYRRIRSGIESEAKHNGYNTTFLSLGEDFYTSEQLDRMLKSRGIRGILFNSIYHKETFFELDWDYYACVKINQFPMELQVDSVSGNGYAAMKLAFEKALELGYQRPAFATCTDDVEHIENRYDSAFFFLQQKLQKQNQIEPFLFDYQLGKIINQQITNWLLKVKPDVLISNWGFSSCCYEYCELTGQCLKFIHLELPHPDSKSSGVLSDNEDIGAKAVELLVQKLNYFEYGLPSKTSHLLVDPLWHEPDGLHCEDADGNQKETLCIYENASTKPFCSCKVC